MSKQCEIVQDLLPLYVDGACSEASAEMVKEHLTTCADCNAIYQQMLSHTSEDILHEESKSVIERHETKEKQKNRRNIIAAVLVFIVLSVIAIFTLVSLLPINFTFEINSAAMTAKTWVSLVFAAITFIVVPAVLAVIEYRITKKQKRTGLYLLLGTFASSVLLGVYSLLVGLLLLIVFWVATPKYHYPNTD